MVAWKSEQYDWLCHVQDPVDRWPYCTETRRSAKVKVNGVVETNGESDEEHDFDDLVPGTSHGDSSSGSSTATASDASPPTAELVKSRVDYESGGSIELRTPHVSPHYTIVMIRMCKI